MPKVMLGYSIPESPGFYKNFIDSHRHVLPRPIDKDSVNELLKMEPCRVVLRRRRWGEPEDGYVFLMKIMKRVARTDSWGQWYLDFPSKKDEMIFRLRWA
jgi:hypothetical protein